MRMTGPTIRGIDQLVMVVRDLEGAMAALREVGFGVVRGGQHVDGRTENAWNPSFGAT
jgi:Glyoxalase-like domain